MCIRSGYWERKKIHYSFHCLDKEWITAKRGGEDRGKEWAELVESGQITKTALDKDRTNGWFVEEPLCLMSRIISKEFIQSISHWWFFPWWPMCLVRVSLSKCITYHVTSIGAVWLITTMSISKTISTKYLCLPHCPSLCISPVNQETFLKKVMI